MAKITKEHRINGTISRSNGPAIEYYDGDWKWCLHGERHRYYGPFCSWGDYWNIHGKHIK